MRFGAFGDRRDVKPVSRDRQPAGAGLWHVGIRPEAAVRRCPDARPPSEGPDARLLARKKPCASSSSRVEDDRLRFEGALAKGEISEADLFDLNYAPIAGTDPKHIAIARWISRILLAGDPGAEFSASTRPWCFRPPWIATDIPGATTRSTRRRKGRRRMEQRQFAQPADFRRHDRADGRAQHHGGLEQTYPRDLGGGKESR